MCVYVCMCTRMQEVILRGCSSRTIVLFCEREPLGLERLELARLAGQ